MNESTLFALTVIGIPTVLALSIIAYITVIDYREKKEARRSQICHLSAFPEPETEQTISLEMKLSTEQLEYLTKCYQHGLAKLDPTHPDYKEFCNHLAQFSEELEFRARNS